MRTESVRRWQIGLLISIAAMLLLAVSVSTVAQEKQLIPAEKPAAKQKEKPPISKQELLTVLQLAGIAPQRLLALVKERGVDFQSSITDEAELGKAGAAPELVEAIGANYRPRKKSFGEKLNALGKSNGATSPAQTNTTVGDIRQGATLNSPATTVDATNAAAPPAGGSNPPAQNLGESVKQFKDAIKQLKKKKPPKPEPNAATQPTQPPTQTTPPESPPATPTTKPPGE